MTLKDVFIFSILFLTKRNLSQKWVNDCCTLYQKKTTNIIEIKVRWDFDKFANLRSFARNQVEKKFRKKYLAYYDKSFIATDSELSIVWVCEKDAWRNIYIEESL